MGEDVEPAPKPHRKSNMSRLGAGLKAGTDREGEMLSPMCARVCMRVHICVCECICMCVEDNPR